MNKLLRNTLASELDAKLTFLATVFSICPGLVVQAQEINSFEGDQLDWCSTAYYDDDQNFECEQYKQIYEQQKQQEPDEDSNPSLDNTEEDRPEETNNSGQVRGYVGGSLGAFFPDSDFTEAFGGSIFFGAEFNKNLGLELETILLGGITESEILDYSAWAVLINPRLIIPLDANSQDASFLFFLSPGIGVSQTEADLDFGDFQLEEEDETRFTIQVKLGLEYNISRSNSLFIQGRYLTQTTEDSVFVVDLFPNELFSIEAGTTFKF